MCLWMKPRALSQAVVVVNAGGSADRTKDRATAATAMMVLESNVS